MHLRYDLITAVIHCKEERRAETVMHELGITYQHATPQSILDEWWFWNCSGVPAKLPEFLTPLNRNPHEQIGWGLSKEDADKIAAGALGAA